MAETKQELRERLEREWNKGATNWVNGVGTRPLVNFTVVGGVKVYNSYEDYLNG